MQLKTKAGRHSEVYDFKQKNIRYKKIALVLFKESVKCKKHAPRKIMFDFIKKYISI